jgi:hypothetical protein
VPGRVIGRWSDDKVLIRLDDGRVFEAPAPEEVRDFDVGDRVDLYFDPDGTPVGWYLTDKQQGVDLRGWGSADERPPDQVP